MHRDFFSNDENIDGNNRAVENNVVPQAHVDEDCHEVVLRFVVHDVQHVVPLEDVRQEHTVVQNSCNCAPESGSPEGSQPNRKLEGQHDGCKALDDDVDGVKHEPPVATGPELVPGPVEPDIPADAENSDNGPWDSNKCDVSNIPVVLEVVEPSSIFIEVVSLIIFWEPLIDIIPLEFIVVFVWVIVVVVRILFVVIVPVVWLVLVYVVSVIVDVPIVNDRFDAFNYWSNSFL